MLAVHDGRFAIPSRQAFFSYPDLIRFGSLVAGYLPFHRMMPQLSVPESFFVKERCCTL